MGGKISLYTVNWVTRKFMIQSKKPPEGGVFISVERYLCFYFFWAFCFWGGNTVFSFLQK